MQVLLRIGKKIGAGRRRCDSSRRPPLNVSLSFLRLVSNLWKSPGLGGDTLHEFVLCAATVIAAKRHVGSLHQLVGKGPFDEEGAPPRLKRFRDILALSGGQKLNPEQGRMNIFCARVDRFVLVKRYREWTILFDSPSKTQKLLLSPARREPRQNVRLRIHAELPLKVRIKTGLPSLGRLIGGNKFSVINQDAELINLTLDSTRQTKSAQVDPSPRVILRPQAEESPAKRDPSLCSG